MKQRQAIISHKCPRCRTGSLFVHPAFSLGFGKMHKNCPHCGLKYEIEPGFFWGSMYFNYAFSVVIGLTSGVIVYQLTKETDYWIWAILATVGMLLLILSPFIFRYSRTLMLYMFSSIRYQPELGK